MHRARGTGGVEDQVGQLWHRLLACVAQQQRARREGEVCHMRERQRLEGDVLQAAPRIKDANLPEIEDAEGGELRERRAGEHRELFRHEQHAVLLPEELLEVRRQVSHQHGQEAVGKGLLPHAAEHAQARAIRDGADDGLPVGLGLVGPRPAPHLEMPDPLPVPRIVHLLDRPVFVLHLSAAFAKHLAQGLDALSAPEYDMFVKEFRGDGLPDMADAHERALCPHGLNG